ncbi:MULTISPECIES: complex I NDUFA9 subunit family protein [unclassified Ruegeria]|uniref:complex I NDUFA9 subunit family protein n=1 Tax=unclassified Ruegeria TaxID=2625375 RepID=UPI001ADB1717|nr:MULTISPECIES: complex I NDUFA9 subunit family protein [unclassified Ruegeria]MBO9412276.1 complex I NDUFA9 subunit family protein [Ruegeria sp. R8_1]MBO9417418.1 complex I NDUFA9 subunit family protein [Ruegeria sp. R8_2]
MSKLVTIYGGSGFVGRYVARRMANEGWRVRVAVRRPNEAMFVKPYGVVGQVEPILCNIRDDASVAAAMQGADAVVNCVGVLNELGKNAFDAVQADGAERIARIAAEQGITTMVHVSAIGADADSDSEYSQTKAQGEAGVLAHMPNAVILRPSVIFGTEDQFFNRFAGMTRMGPFLPLVGAETKFQPVYVDDVAKAAVQGVLGQAAAGTYELGGPEVKTFRALMQQMLDVIHRRRVIVGMPFFAARIMAGVLDIVKYVSFQLFPNSILTRDQLKNLRRDNVVSDGAKSFADLGIEPATLESVLPDYLWKFRPSGQYDEIQRSADNLRT